ncbi:hypothetical protein ACMGDK_11370 [Chryseobacterium sp. DT-3]|uniref:hypothetical protein n=1 Tax=Chryseobacterium sp. DT-3 TaxID=3396164 RepID=UPI003F1AF435
MAHKIVFRVSAIVPTIPVCVKLTPSMFYEDTIEKDLEYTGQSQETVSFTNYCNVVFSVPDFLLFTNTENGGNFEARIGNFSIGINQQVEVPVNYFGICKSNSAYVNYNISFNGNNSVYKLNINAPEINNPPQITTVELVLENREDHVFTLNDFISHYSDIDGDQLSAIILTGDVSSFRLNGNLIISGQEISVYDINVGAFKYLAEDTDNEINVIVTLKAKDERGEVSN